MLDDQAARELELFIRNDSGVWSGYVEPMFRASERYYVKGAGDYGRLVKGLERVAAAGARAYHAEHGSMFDKWHQVFSVATRHAVAVELADYFLAELRAGNSWRRHVSV